MEKYWIFDPAFEDSARLRVQQGFLKGNGRRQGEGLVGVLGRPELTHGQMEGC